MFKNSFVVFAVIAAMGLTTALAQPQGPPQRGKDRQRSGERMISKLDLTDAQELQMKKLRIDLMKKQTQLHSKIQTLRLDNKELFLSEKPDRNAIEKNIKAVSGVQEQLKLNMLDHWFAVNAMLTPEQQKTWKKVPMEFEKGMRMHGRGRGPGRPMMGNDDGPPNFD